MTTSNEQTLSTLTFILNKLNISLFDSYMVNNKLSDNLSDIQIDQIISFLSTQQSLVDDQACFWNYINIQSISDKHLNNIIELNLNSIQIYYTSIKASEEILLSLYNKNINDIIIKRTLLPKIKTKDILLSASKDIELSDILYENTNIDLDIIISIVETILSAVDYKYIYLRILKHFLNSNSFSAEMNNIIYLFSYKDDVPSVIFSEIAKQQFLLKETIEGIMTYHSGDETNSMFARTELIHNEFIPEEYKISILENQEKYPIYNKNNYNPLEYLNSLTKLFLK